MDFPHLSLFTMKQTVGFSTAQLYTYKDNLHVFVFGMRIRQANKQIQYPSEKSDHLLLQVWQTTKIQIGQQPGTLITKKAGDRWETESTQQGPKTKGVYLKAYPIRVNYNNSLT